MTTVWRVCLLGGLRAERDAEVVARFRSQKIGALLAYLALFPRRPHTREELADLLWPDSEPETARTNLRTALSSLRRQLEPPGIPAGTVLVSSGSGDISLNPSLIETDVAQFEEVIKRATRPALPRDEYLRLLEEAVSLYGGPLLPGVYETWATTERDRLASAYLDALRRLVAHHEQAGNPEIALGFARRSVTADPLAEDAHADVIRLLQAVGDRAGARRQFDELSRLLEEQFGGEPAPETRALLAAKPAPRLTTAPSPVPDAKPRTTTVDEPIGHSGLKTLTGTRQPLSPPAAPLNLPLTLTRFFGREQELAELRARLSPQGTSGSGGTRLVTLTGPGGSGKTRLAVETARGLGADFPGGIWFVPLADLREAEHIGGALADALGLPRAQTTSPLQQAIEALAQKTSADRPVLLVLDNFEQLVGEGGADVAHELLAGVPSLSCLVTSRQRLLIDGEQEFALAPLPAPFETGKTIWTGDTSAPEGLLAFPCVQLFVDRARAARPDFQLSSRNADSIANLCSKLEGVPLAIELAAAWSQTLTPSQMRERLDQRFDLLVTRRRDALGRHRSLRAAVEWGWDLLAPEARDFFAQLSVFRGGWTLEAAEAVTGRPDALMLLTLLRDHSFVLTEEEQEDIGQMRFRMLETLREFADEQVASVADQSTLDVRHYEYFLQLAEQAEPQLHGPEQALWLRRL
ncbi:MAG: BTAD domain-containing putative transcriptional regulator, partial [Armatimonadota bacterium]